MDHEGRTCLTYAKASNELARMKQSNNKQHHVTSGELSNHVNHGIIFDAFTIFRNHDCIGQFVNIAWMRRYESAVSNDKH